MDLGAAAIFPDAGIGSESKLRRLVAERFEEMKQILVSRPRQPSVEEHGHRREDDAAIAVMLLLMNRGVADANRPFAAIALEVWSNRLLERGARHDAIERPHGRPPRLKSE